MSLDFSPVRNAARGLLKKRNRLFSLSTSNALLEFLLEGAPQLREHLTDSRRLADRQLKSTCEVFIDFCGDFLIGPVRVYLAKATSHIKNNGGDTQSLKKQHFGQPAVVRDYLTESQKCLRTRLPVVQRSLQLYLANRETEFILFRPVRNLIVSIFQQLQQLFPVHYTEEEQALIGAPTPEQISVLLSAMLLKRRESSPQSFDKEAPPTSESVVEENQEKQTPALGSKSFDKEAPPPSESVVEENQEKQTPALGSNIVDSSTIGEEEADGGDQKE